MYKFPEEMKKAYESSPISFVYYQNIDDRAVPVLASDGFCKNTGMPRERVLEWLRRGMFERMHPDDVGVMSRISDDFLHKRGSYDVVFRCRIDNDSSDQESNVTEDEYVSIHGLGKWQTMPDGTELAVISYANISATNEATREQIAVYTLLQKDRFYTDPLTGLPNINYMHEFGDEKLETIRADKKIPHIIYTDVYAMQSYNNQYGFSQGDKLLCLIAETLKKHFHHSLIIRGADDHFITITHLDDEAELERRLYEANAYIRNNAQGNTYGIRSGVYAIGADTSLSEAIDQAKHTLKRISDDLNREVAFFSQEANNEYWRRRYILEHFDRAMENGWIKVFYHALHRIENKKIAAFEGLARWVDPVRGIISPADFIPVLLKYHLLYKLDLYMFEQVCREIKLRHDNGLPLLPVSINFSRQDFDHADILGEMNRLYDKYDLDRYVDKSYFIVEITEQDIATGTEKLHNALDNIRDNGYRLWLDDFGSGYSAINMFSRFDFDLIKYDMDLIRHLDDKKGVNRLILTELVFVAKKLGIHTLVEGVETEEHLRFAKEIGCELAQGFYFHKPESLDEILFRLNSGDKIKPCETPDERTNFEEKWFQ